MKHIHFVTGRLAQHSLQMVVTNLATQVGFEYSVQVMPITVAALMTCDWIASRLEVPADADAIFLPGYCEGDLTQLETKTGLPVTRGPRDLRQLPQFFQQGPASEDYGKFNIEIIAEINHCPNLSLKEIVATAQALVVDGADVIDLGCNPDQSWPEVSAAVKALRDQGHRVSIDSFNATEVEAAVKAGAELVLSVNSTNREAAVDWGVEVVVVPDEPKTLAGLDETIDFLARANVPLRIDPILEPIPFGFSSSLGRYLDVRGRYPDAEMMMGIGNLTELTDADSAGINALLIGFCQEQGIRSVLTTQVINWARTSVKECDLSRRLMYHATANQVLPKHLEENLIMLRDELCPEVSPGEFTTLANELKDSNYRVFVADGEIHIVSSGVHLHSSDPFLLMDQLCRSAPDGGLPRNLDPSHAFYLGYELCKAKTALTLGKQYTQDEALNWGLATETEPRHYLKRTRGKKSS